MTVFKAYIKVLKTYKVSIIMYSALLILFGTLAFQTSKTQTNFEVKKPNITIINEDKKIGLTLNLIDYLKNTTNIVDIKEEEINDALFFRDVDYVIYIPINYREDILDGKNPPIKVKGSGNYNSSLAEMILTRYLKISDIYKRGLENEKDIINKINETINSQIEIELKSKVDNNELTKATIYYNFANYSILAGIIYVVCMILSSFNKKTIKNRTSISSMSLKKYNQKLLMSNGFFALFLWLVYVIVSFILVGKIMFSISGLIYIINSFIFSLSVLSLAFVIGNISINKNAINGIVNVLALGSSFLCGAFVPSEYLPDFVLKIAHVFPSYYFINTNDKIKLIETFNFETLKPIFINFGILIMFIIIFIVITNIITNNRRSNS